ncbi:hypothetical protein GOBAR_DD29420 [Gossypium barbadense]|nr:hypothetical protein GOBAR_DD29420 [Gossypium barbadense]
MAAVFRAWVVITVVITEAAVVGGFPATFKLERSIPLASHELELSELVERDRLRHGRLLESSSVGVVGFPVSGTYDPFIVGLYYTKLQLGSPPREFNVQIDTGSDVLWVGPHYNIDLRSISVGGQVLSIDASVFSTSINHGAIIDSGTTLSYLADEAYNAFIDAINNAVSEHVHPVLSHGNQCYLITDSIDHIFPEASLNFAGGAALILHPEDYLIQQNPIGGSAVWCIGFKTIEGQKLTILGDLVMKDKIFVYDLEKQQIGWVNYDCSSSVNVSVNTEPGKTKFVNARPINNSSSPDELQTTVALLLNMFMLADQRCSSGIQVSDSTCSGSSNQCSYTFQYGDGSGTSGYYVSDLLHFNTILPGHTTGNATASIMFGCSMLHTGKLTDSHRAVDGIFGFGQQSLSVISQLSSQRVTPRTFSHCLKGNDDGGGILVLGEIVEPDMVYTPLVPSISVIHLSGMLQLFPE